MEKLNTRKKYIIVCILFLGIISSLKVKGQDIHFSQFYFSPLSINPANTGIFTGDMRLSTNYKSQWKTITNPYKTYCASFDMSLAKKKLGLGIAFFNDKAGKSQMGLTLGNVSASYNLKVNKYNHFIAGLQVGFGQKSINTTDLKWDSQYNGTEYDPAIASGETVLGQSKTYVDASAGVMWNYNERFSKFKTSTGLALFHVNKPNESFYDTDKMNMKIVLHNSSQIRLADKPAYILPQLLFMKQGMQREINFGLHYKFVFSPINSIFRMKNRIDIGARREDQSESRNSLAFFGGVQYRFKDALILVGGFELMKSLLISFSYDINVSKLNIASKRRGGPELALTYKVFLK